MTGPQVKAWLEDSDYDFSDQKPVGRVEQPKRRDWCLEVSEKLFPLIKPVCLYTVDTLVLDTNMLRDSVLMRLEIYDFEAYIHTNSVLWVVCYQELRSLTNARAIELNPYELCRVYGNLWVVGTLLKTPDAPTILQYRRAAAALPWK